MLHSWMRPSSLRQRHPGSTAPRRIVRSRLPEPFGCRVTGAGCAVGCKASTPCPSADRSRGLFHSRRCIDVQRPTALLVRFEHRSIAWLAFSALPVTGSLLARTASHAVCRRESSKTPSQMAISHTAKMNQHGLVRPRSAPTPGRSTKTSTGKSRV